ncbi:MAG: ABC transporter ATP-binding protein [Terriglobales bacterium]
MSENHIPLAQAEERPGEVDPNASQRDQPPVVIADHLGHNYGTRQALHDISFCVGQGEIFSVLGPNGSGKSTLFRILSTLTLPSRGRVVIQGYDVAREVMQVRRQIGVVFQSPTVDEQLTIVENLRCHGHMYGIPGSVLTGRIETTLDQLRLADRRNEKTAALSEGQRRQIDVAKASLHQPPVLLLDEPSTGLDPGARLDLWQQLQFLKEYGTTVLLTTHILDEADRCDRVLILHRGRLVAEGTPATLRARVRGDVVILEVAELEEMQTRISGTFQRAADDCE